MTDGASARHSLPGLHRDLVLDHTLETVVGTPAELWLGVDDETDEERAARLDAACDILADDPDMPGAEYLTSLVLEDLATEETSALSAASIAGVWRGAAR